MPHRKAHAIGMIRLLRRLGPIPRRRRIPKQQQPDLIRLEYYKALLPFVHIARAAFASRKQELFYLIQQERRTLGKMDETNRDRAYRLVQEAKHEAETLLRPSELEQAAARYAQRTSDFQKAQLGKQVVAAMSVPLSAIEAPITNKLQGFVQENVKLIKSVHERYFDRIEKTVRAAFEEGIRPETLAELFVERDGMAEDDALRIAKDQIGKLSAELNQERQEAMGVTGYTWRTANDGRVRDEHGDREGQHYEWDDPPEDGHPGEAILCRCYAEPDFAPILEQL